MWKRSTFAAEAAAAMRLRRPRPRSPWTMITDPTARIASTTCITVSEGMLSGLSEQVAGLSSVDNEGSTDSSP